MAGRGRALQLLGERIAATVAAARAFPQLQAQAQQLQDACDLVTRTTAQLFRIGANDPKRMLADSSEYLTLFGHMVVAWIWLRQANAAAQALAGDAGARTAYYRGKLAACRYFYRWELPKVAAIAATLVQPDTTILELDPESLCP
jgi:butyryl-CoA dehydrogenase